MRCRRRGTRRRGRSGRRSDHRPRTASSSPARTCSISNRPVRKSRSTSVPTNTSSGCGGAVHELGTGTSGNVPGVVASEHGVAGNASGRRVAGQGAQRHRTVRHGGLLRRRHRPAPSASPLPPASGSPWRAAGRTRRGYRSDPSARWQPLRPRRTVCFRCRPGPSEADRTEVRGPRCPVSDPRSSADAWPGTPRPPRGCRRCRG